MRSLGLPARFRLHNHSMQKQQIETYGPSIFAQTAFLFLAPREFPEFQQMLMQSKYCTFGLMATIETLAAYLKSPAPTYCGQCHSTSTYHYCRDCLRQTHGFSPPDQSLIATPLVLAPAQSCPIPGLCRKKFRQPLDGASGRVTMPQYLVWECPVTFGLYSFLVPPMRISARPKCELCHNPVSPAELAN